MGQGHLLGFGHSHLTALETAYDAWRSARGATAPVIDLVQLLDPRFKPASGVGIDNDLVQAGLGARIAEAGRVPDFAFSCYSGNDYHVLSMVRHPDPYDFVLPDRADLKLDGDAQILPFAAIEATMRTALQQAIADLTAISRSLPCPLVNIASPPPIPDNAFLNRPTNAFWSKAESLGISSASFRWKVWRLQSMIYEEGCASAGIVTLPPPEAAVDADGFMRPAGWHPDGVHGTTWYGVHVLDQIAALARVRIEAA